MFSHRDKVLCEYLVLRCLQHDSQAAVELVALFQQPLFYYLRRMVDDEQTAWDVLQETWLQVFRSLNKLREPRALPAFLYRVAHNAALVHLRRVADPISLDGCSDEAQAPEQEDDFSPEEAAKVHAALALLSLPHREVLTLRFLEDLSLEEIAEVVAVPVGTVKSRLFHARKALRALLKEDAPHAK